MSTNITRQIFLDTETTGINKLGIYYEKHRIIEIGAVEVINRRLTGKIFHVYLQPNRFIDPIAFNIHGISDEFLINKPTFKEVADEFLKFILGGELIIHNALFDIGFLDYEFKLLNRGIPKIDTFCKITDSLVLARKMFPGKRNSLDALCNRYRINKSKRTIHGALLDAEILAEIFLLMTSGQIVINFTMKENNNQSDTDKMFQRNRIQRTTNMLLKIIYASKKELIDHEKILDLIYKTRGNCLWRTKRQ